MFRNPRENIAQSTGTTILPSVGRPPSPPASLDRKPSTTSLYAPPPSAMSTKALGPRRGTGPKADTMPMIGRGSTTPRKAAATVGNGKAKGKPNGSILTFFKKAEDIEDDLFVQTKMAPARTRSVQQVCVKREDTAETPQGGPVLEDDYRFQETGSSVKRRRMNEPTQGSITGSTDLLNSAEEAPPSAGACSPPPPEAPSGLDSFNTLSGPFVEESDSEAEEESAIKIRALPDAEPVTADIVPPSDLEKVEAVEKVPTPPRPPLLSREATSVVPSDDFADFENIDDFEDDIYDEGEENVARRWMEEQRRIEMEEGGDEEDFDDEDGGQGNDESIGGIGEEDSTDSPSCPICSTNLRGVSDQEAAVHVNNCLDGNPTPLPIKNTISAIAPSSPMRKDPAAPANRFRRPVRAAKPGQENPFDLGGPGGNGGSAFSKLMSGHAEDAAWADAAAAEHKARGKPAYQRTCPFYKILPGFNICVDAFRYGGVEGCRAYFLSHFHSDHYIGLTSSWTHGPIYCSRVTANLVKQQLRVDPKYVISLAFEEKVEVPGTNGVYVTMIPANHCPGSSLYLYEKVTGKGNNPKTQRVLHCGDFRACRAHVEHPLLRPDVIDAVSGKSRQQKIDVCYLDTTYLNPKYAFPNQEEVIKACADMCVSLSKVQADDSDGWEQMKRERAGAGMVKFVRKESNPAIKEEEEEDDVDAMKVATKASGKQRGRLLVIVGTYSIGKERICLGIARALNSKIYAPPGKQRICACLEDEELNSRLTKDPREAQVHMTPLFEIRADTLDDYLKDYKDYFTRAVGFRPSGWNYRPPNSRFVESPSVQTVLHSDNWKSSYSMKELVPQRGSTSRASCFGVPYSEHSSFRELTMFCCALRIDKVIPTVNVGSAKSREKMKGWCERWANDKKKNGLLKLEDCKKW